MYINRGAELGRDTYLRKVHKIRLKLEEGASFRKIKLR
jgi:hypothetical protein